MPTSPKVKQTFLNILPLQTEQDILELGSGWGTLAFPLADRYPKNQIYAYEASLVPYLFCRLRNLFFPKKNLHFLYLDFHQASFSQASLITCYLYPGAMKTLENRFNQELKPGICIASHTFSLPHWKPVKIKYANDLYHTPVFLYKKIK